jgi:hypothetical protein
MTASGAGCYHQPMNRSLLVFLLLAAPAAASENESAPALSQLRSWSCEDEGPAVAPVQGRPVRREPSGPAEFAGSSEQQSVQGAPSLAALAAETVRRGSCGRASDDPDFRDDTLYCTTVIDPAPGFWGGHRAYVSVADGRAIHYHAQTPVFTIGVGAHSGQEFRAVETVTIDVAADGRTTVVKTVPFISRDGSCPNASRSDSFLVRGNGQDRTVTVCTHRLPYESEEHAPFLQEAQQRWAAALRR